MAGLLYNDEILVQYESRELWNETITHLTELFRKDCQNKSVLLRSAAQCWYVLTFWDCCMPKEKLDRTQFESALRHLYAYAKEDLRQDPDCLWLFGYFMSINPMIFPYVSKNFLEVEAVGSSLIELAYTHDPNNRFAKTLYLADIPSKRRKYEKMLQENAAMLPLYFPGQSEIDRYFIDIFSPTP